MYTFVNMCKEVNGLQDEAARIFINPYGEAPDMSEELRNFLQYIVKKEPQDNFTEKLHEQVSRNYA